MDYEIIKLGLLVLNMLVTAGVWIFVRQDSRHKESKMALDHLQKRFDEKFADKCARINAIEVQLSALPTKSDIIRIHTRLDGFHDDMRNLATMIADVSGQVKRINKRE